MLRRERTYVATCSWCPDHLRPDPINHPGGQVEHITPHRTLESALEHLERGGKIAYLLFNGEHLRIHLNEIEVLRKLIASKIKR